MIDFSISDDGKFSVREKNFSFELDVPSKGQYALSIGGRLTVTPLKSKPGDFSEELAMPLQTRPHKAENGTEVTFDSSCRIPFGTSPLDIERKYRVSENSLFCVCDFQLKNSFEMKELDGGGLQIEGVKTFGFSIPPADGVEIAEPEMKSLDSIPDGGTAYDSEIPPVRFAFADGTVKAEFGICSDYWRWINAARIDGSSRFTVVREGSKLVFKWLFYSFKPAAPDALPPPGRPWRTSYMLTWAAPASEKVKNYKDILDLSTMAFPPSACAMAQDGTRTDIPCFESGATLNIMKKWLRAHLADALDGDIFAITGVKDVFCFDASHMERPKLKRLSHRGIGGLTDFIRWANRQLSIKGASLEVF